MRRARGEASACMRWAVRAGVSCRRQASDEGAGLHPTASSSGLRLGDGLASDVEVAIVAVLRENLDVFAQSPDHKASADASNIA